MTDKICSTFGCQTGWLMIKTDKINRVPISLGATEVEDLFWETALVECLEEENQVLISNAIPGWCVVVGDWVANRITRADFLDFMKELSEEYGYVVYITSNGLNNTYGFAVAEDNEVRRAYYYIGDRNKIKLNVGEPMMEEENNNFMFPNTTEEIKLYMEEEQEGRPMITIPTEEIMMELSKILAVAPDAFLGLSDVDVLFATIEEEEKVVEMKEEIIEEEERKEEAPSCSIIEFPKRVFEETESKNRVNNQPLQKEYKKVSWFTRLFQKKQ